MKQLAILAVAVVLTFAMTSSEAVAQKYRHGHYGPHYGHRGGGSAWSISVGNGFNGFSYSQGFRGYGGFGPYGGFYGAPVYRPFYGGGFGYGYGAPGVNFSYGNFGGYRGGCGRW